MKKKNKDKTERFVERKFLIDCHADGRYKYLCNLSNHRHMHVWRVTDSHDPSTFVFLCALSFHTIITERERDLSPLLCI